MPDMAKWWSDDLCFPVNDAVFLAMRLGWVCTISFPIHYYWNHACDKKLYRWWR
jgi:hypothetical protein